MLTPWYPEHVKFKISVKSKEITTIAAAHESIYKTINNTATR